MADDLVSDRANQLVMLVELEELRRAGGVALKREQMSLRVDRDRRDAAAALGQRKRVREREPEIGRAHFVRDDVALPSPRADRRPRARFGAAIALNLCERERGREQPERGHAGEDPSAHVTLRRYYASTVLRSSD